MYARVLFILTDIFLGARVQVEAVIRGLVAQQDHDKISSLIHLLVHDFALSPQSNHRKVQSSRYTITLRPSALVFRFFSVSSVLAMRGETK